MVVELTSKCILDAVKEIVTHPGKFHADELFAVAYLREAGCTAPVSRRVPTPEDLANPRVLIVDVGGQYDPYLLNFDHHQNGADLVRENGVPYSSFGLVVKHFAPVGAGVYERFDKLLVQPIDAHDNGRWPQRDSENPTLALSAVLGWFNPTGPTTPPEMDKVFLKTVDIVRQVLENTMAQVCAWCDAKEKLQNKEFTEQCGSILVLKEYLPWLGHIQSPEFRWVDLVVFPDTLRGGWKVQTVPVAEGSKDPRVPLPTEWWGASGAELQKVLEDEGILTFPGESPEHIFCAKSGFIAGATHRDNALNIARAAYVASR